MDNDINFTIAVVKAEYARRREMLVNTATSSKEREHVLSDLECMMRGTIKIEEMCKRDAMNG